jgi:P-type E1-E2 ATPase
MRPHDEDLTVTLAREPEEGSNHVPVVNPSFDTLQGDRVVGDPTEIALLAFTQEHGRDVRLSTRERHRVALFAIDSSRKLMTTVDEEGERLVAYTKGGPEQVLARCTIPAAERTAALAEAETFAARGLRLLALARRELESVGERDAVESDLDYVGLVALLDQPRAEVPAAVRACHRAGIRVIVITGDHALTALEVARRVGIDVDADDVVAAEHLGEMTDAALDVCSPSGVSSPLHARRRRRS